MLKIDKIKKKLTALEIIDTIKRSRKRVKIGIFYRYACFDGNRI
jgi:hypothetical protein